MGEQPVGVFSSAAREPSVAEVRGWLETVETWGLAMLLGPAPGDSVLGPAPADSVTADGAEMVDVAGDAAGGAAAGMGAACGAVPKVLGSPEVWKGGSVAWAAVGAGVCWT